METKHKEFKAFDKVLVRNHYDRRWKCDVYSHRTGETGVQTIHDIYSIKNVLPYEGNEHLVGTTYEPDEEVKLKEGEWVFVIDKPVGISPTTWEFTQFSHTKYNQFFDKDDTNWDFAIRFSDFNPNDMAETKKHILCVKNSKIIRYKG